MILVPPDAPRNTVYCIQIAHFRPPQMCVDFTKQENDIPGYCLPAKQMHRQCVSSAGCNVAYADVALRETEDHRSSTRFTAYKLLVLRCEIFVHGKYCT